jgi:hypothetical protein
MAKDKLTFTVVINIDRKVNTKDEILKLAQDIADSICSEVSTVNRVLVKPRALIETIETIA